MAFCKNCGASIPDGATFCSSCGTPVNDAPPQQQQPQPQQYQTYNTNPAQPVTGDADVQNNKFMAVLSYIGILVLIPIFAAKDSAFARFHAKQGTTLCIFEIAYSIAVFIIDKILYWALPWYLMSIYSIVSAILSIGSLFFLALAIMGIVNACQGQKKELPLIGKIDILGKFMK